LAFIKVPGGQAGSSAPARLPEKARLILFTWLFALPPKHASQMADLLLGGPIVKKL
jgi:hypothetical protein